MHVKLTDIFGDNDQLARAWSISKATSFVKSVAAKEDAWDVLEDRIMSLAKKMWHFIEWGS